jgi:hypothetical protein
VHTALAQQPHEPHLDARQRDQQCQADEIYLLRNLPRRLGAAARCGAPIPDMAGKHARHALPHQ